MFYCIIICTLFILYMYFSYIVTFVNLSRSIHLNYFIDDLNHIIHALQSYVAFCLCLIICWQKFVSRQINFYKVSNLRDYPIKNLLLRIKVRIVLYVLTDYATKQNTFNFLFSFLWKNFSYPAFKFSKL